MEIKDSWFNLYHTHKLTEEFIAWWKTFYGSPGQCEMDGDELHEYFVRMAFSLEGWLAAKAMT
jgi:hypothetical protein